MYSLRYICTKCYNRLQNGSVVKVNFCFYGSQSYFHLVFCEFWPLLLQCLTVPSPSFWWHANAVVALKEEKIPPAVFTHYNHVNTEWYPPLLKARLAEFPSLQEIVLLSAYFTISVTCRAKCRLILFSNSSVRLPSKVQNGNSIYSSSIKRSVSFILNTIPFISFCGSKCPLRLLPYLQTTVSQCSAWPKNICPENSLKTLSVHSKGALNIQERLKLVSNC